MDAQVRQILEWSAEPEKAKSDFSSFIDRYREKTGQAFDLEPVNAKRLLTVFGNSHFLSQFLLNNPEEADGVVDSPCIETDKLLKDFREELSKSSKGNLSLEIFGGILRRYKYREYLRLTIKDLSQAAGLESVMGEISDLAIALIERGLKFLSAQMEKEWGKAWITEEDGRRRPCGFAVIAMGKLGGRELNYSSDVDLQYVYTSDTGAVEGPKETAPHEFFIRLSERLSKLLSEKTGEGFLYRVDLNLRPEGRSGTLANSLPALERYYETFGEEWERQALIKATPIAGDERLGKEFKKLIQPFVWRKSIDYQTLEKIKEMKRKVHDSVKRSRSKGFHVKLDEGGIRDIEYFVQTLQLLYGGGHLLLRSPSTLSALDQLARLELIGSGEASQLKDAYLFLRRLEHRLQLVHESQTHTVPTEVQEQRRLARRMGYFEDDPEEARERLLDDLTRYSSMVKNTFKNLFE
jgi:[glutamine synthetase] adenylyltransferase / [glutamine synthetase]-adenylyl-L-tyrosine phosphorylase